MRRLRQCLSVISVRIYIFIYFRCTPLYCSRDIRPRDAGTCVRLSVPKTENLSNYYDFSGIVRTVGTRLLKYHWGAVGLAILDILADMNGSFSNIIPRRTRLIMDITYRVRVTRTRVAVDSHRRKHVKRPRTGNKKKKIKNSPTRRRRPGSTEIASRRI